MTGTLLNAEREVERLEQDKARLEGELKSMKEKYAKEIGVAQLKWEKSVLQREVERLREHFRSCGDCMDCVEESNPLLAESLAAEEREGDDD
jgi:hypothetical protein